MEEGVRQTYDHLQDCKNSVKVLDYLRQQSYKICHEYLDTVKDKTITKNIMLRALLWANNWTRWDLYCEIMETCKVTRAAAIHGFRCALDSGYADYRAALIYFQHGFTTEEMLKRKREREAYDSLPEYVTLYRGCSKQEANFDEGNCFGISWTLKREIAEFFAFRHTQEDRAVFSIEVHKDEIAALLFDRKEYEALYFGDMFEEDYKIVTEKPTEYYYKYMEAKN